MRVTVALLTAALTLNTAAEIRIIAVMASNVSSSSNAMDLENYADWIELFNQSSSQPQLTSGKPLLCHPLRREPCQHR